MIRAAPKTPPRHRREPPPIRRYCCLRPMPGVQRIQHLARGKKLARTCDAFSAPGARAVRGLRPEKPITGTEMKNSSYLDQPLLPITVALPRMLARIESELDLGAPRGKATAGNTSRVDA